MATALRAGKKCCYRDLSASSRTDRGGLWRDAALAKSEIYQALQERG